MSSSWARRTACSAAASRSSAAVDSSPGPVELGRRGAAGRRADAPASGTEAVADVGHDDRHRDGRSPRRSRRRPRRHGPRCRSARRAGVASPGRSEWTCGRTDSPTSGTDRGGRRARRRRGRHRSCRSRSTRCSARLAESGPSTTTAVSASPSAASTAGCQPASISIRSSRVPRTPSMSARRSAPARARATSSACWSASTRADQLDATSAARWRAWVTDSSCASAMRRRLSARSTSATSGVSTTSASAQSARNCSVSASSAPARSRNDVGALGTPAQLALAALDAGADRPQLATHLGRRTGRLDAGRVVEQRSRRLLALFRERCFVDLELLDLGRQLRRARSRLQPARRGSGRHRPRGWRRRRRRAAGHGRAPSTGAAR